MPALLANVRPRLQIGPGMLEVAGSVEEGREEQGRQGIGIRPTSVELAGEAPLGSEAAPKGPRLHRRENAQGGDGTVRMNWWHCANLVVFVAPSFA